MTPGELSVWFRQKRRDEVERQRLTEYNIYSLASLIRAAVWAKKMPSFEDFAGKSEDKQKPAEHKQMTDEQMYEQVRLLNKLFGGTEE